MSEVRGAYIESGAFIWHYMVYSEPVWNDHPKCQEKFGFAWNPMVDRNFLNLQNGLSRGVVPDKLHCIGNSVHGILSHFTVNLFICKYQTLQDVH